MYATEHQAALLRAAVAEIKKHPETLDMGVWAMRWNCGSVCCLAGQIVRHAVSDKEWEVILDTPKPVPSIAARAALRLESNNVLCLFDVALWPEEFQGGGQPTPEQLENRVEWWIEHGE
jgi:hypothetical protein